MVGRLGLRSYGITNAILGWFVVTIVLLGALKHALDGEILWAGMGVIVAAVALIPPLMLRRLDAMIAWEVLGLAAFPVISRSIGVLADPAAYIAVASLALVIAVELDAYTAVEMAPRFAVAFVVVVTMGVAGLWTIAQYASDLVIGTTMLQDQATLMWDLIFASAIGLIAGTVFELYVRRISPGYAILARS